MSLSWSQWWGLSAVIGYDDTFVDSGTAVLCLRVPLIGERVAIVEPTSLDGFFATVNYFEPNAWKAPGITMTEWDRKHAASIGGR